MLNFAHKQLQHIFSGDFVVFLSSLEVGPTSLSFESFLSVTRGGGIASLLKTNKPVTLLLVERHHGKQHLISHWSDTDQLSSSIFIQLLSILPSEICKHQHPVGCRRWVVWAGNVTRWMSLFDATERILGVIWLACEYVNRITCMWKDMHLMKCWNRFTNRSALIQP
jgi:hypothetical protein